MKKGIIRKTSIIVVLVLIVSLSVLESINFVRGEDTTISSDKPIIDHFGQTTCGFLMIWSFDCENKSVGIKVELFNKRNFLKYDTGQPYKSIILSPGSNTNDSGNYQAKYSANYYFVFSIDEALNVTDSINIEFEVWGHATFLSLFIGIALGPICFIIVVIGLVAFLNWSKKKEKQVRVDTNQEAVSVIDNKEVIFCGNCGAKNKPTQNYCVKCGSELTHEVL
ncbi:MAG: zinc ribbon domain-containing protein [Candidatus Heimdallarchaeota archaeon]